MKTFFICLKLIADNFLSGCYQFLEFILLSSTFIGENILFIYHLYIHRGKYPLYMLATLARIQKWVAYSLSSRISLFRIHLSFYHFIFTILRGCLRFHFSHIYRGNIIFNILFIYHLYIHRGKYHNYYSLYISSIHSSGKIFSLYARYRSLASTNE